MQQIVFNSALRTRSTVQRFYVPKPLPDESITVKFNGKPIPSIVQINYQCNQLVMNQDKE